jgi:glycosyltransferase involved in cell wall biosynthesis
VSTPLDWDEVPGCRPEEFTVRTVLERFADRGDPASGIDDAVGSLDPLLALAEELGVGGQVRLRGFCSDVQDRLPGYRAYVHASYSESSSLAIMEAMAVGLPVLSGDAGALGELFDDPTEGRFWPLDDPEAAARTLVDLMEAPAELDRAGRAARRRFLRDYDADTVAPRLLSFLTAARAEGRGSLTDR